MGRAKDSPGESPYAARTSTGGLTRGIGTFQLAMLGAGGT